jgi:hypothetical protein
MDYIKLDEDIKFIFNELSTFIDINLTQDKSITNFLPFIFLKKYIDRNYTPKRSDNEDYDMLERFSAAPLECKKRDKIPKHLRQNEKDKHELLNEQDLVISLCTKNAETGQNFNEDIRLQALKAVQKKVGYSVDRYELEAKEKIYRCNFLFSMAFVSIVVYCTFKIISHSSLASKNDYVLSFFAIALALLSLVLPPLVKITYEPIVNIFLISNKRRLEIVEQAIVDFYLVCVR